MFRMLHRLYKYLLWFMRYDFFNITILFIVIRYLITSSWRHNAHFVYLLCSKYMPSFKFMWSLQVCFFCRQSIRRRRRKKTWRLVFVLTNTRCSRRTKGQIGVNFDTYFMTINDLYNGAKSVHLPLGCWDMIFVILNFHFRFGQKVKVKLGSPSCK